MKTLKIFLSLFAISTTLFTPLQSFADAKLDDELTQAMKLKGNAELELRIDDVPISSSVHNVADETGDIIEFTI